MKAVCKKIEAQNEYASPLTGTPYFRNSGIIFALDRNEQRYAVGRIDFERFDDQNFQYIFTPEWSVIDSLPTSIFQGIPGLDMSIRLERYYRVNMTPYFITERTPSEGREDLWELLGEVGLDYYDRFEWLLRTNMRCGIDNLIVERAVMPRQIEWNDHTSIPENLNPGDRVVIQSFESIAGTSRQLRQSLILILRSGAQIWDNSEDRLLSEEECGILLKLLLLQDSMDAKQHRENRGRGIEKAKQEGKPIGRKRISVDPTLLKQVAEDLEKHRISEAEAMRRVGLSSRSTFYRRIRELDR